VGTGGCRWHHPVIITDIIRRKTTDEDLNALEVMIRQSLATDTRAIRALFQPGLDASAALTGQLNLSLAMFSSLPYVVLGVAIFFYCLGALYDDRRDRSVLFWKSLPVSDLETVLSKVVSATLVAPLLAIMVYVGVVMVNLLMFSVFVLIHGGSTGLLWQMAAPASLGLAQLVALPGYALSILPVVGWLLLCSAWARRKPLLWALAVPVCVGFLIGWLRLTQVMSVPDVFWMEVVLRPLGQLFGLLETWLYLPAPVLGEMATQDMLGTRPLGQPGAIFWDVMTRPRLWIGAGIAALMIAGAVALRRWREEGG